MANTLGDVLALSWRQQEEHLRGLSRKELEILWFEMQTYRETFDLFYLAVYSVLRDFYELENRKEAGGIVQPPNSGIRGSSNVGGWDSDFSDRGAGGRPSP